MSPLAVENLTPDSSIVSVREAISESMSQCMKEGGREQKECAGMIYSIAREKSGKSLNEGRQR